MSFGDIHGDIQTENHRETEDEDFLPKWALFGRPLRAGLSKLYFF